MRRTVEGRLRHDDPAAGSKSREIGRIEAFVVWLKRSWQWLAGTECHQSKDRQGADTFAEASRAQE
jgi:hypothetical protein